MTREASGVGASTGGGIEAVVPRGVRMRSFSHLRPALMTTSRDLHEETERLAVSLAERGESKAAQRIRNAIREVRPPRRPRSDFVRTLVTSSIAARPETPKWPRMQLTCHRPWKPRGVGRSRGIAQALGGCGRHRFCPNSLYAPRATKHRGRLVRMRAAPGLPRTGASSARHRRLSDGAGRSHARVRRRSGAVSVARRPPLRKVRRNTTQV
jgi:hypothetical protein